MFTKSRVGLQIISTLCRFGILKCLYGLSFAITTQTQVNQPVEKFLKYRDRICEKNRSETRPLVFPGVVYASALYLVSSDTASESKALNQILLGRIRQRLKKS